MDIHPDNFVKSVKKLYLLMNKHIERELKAYGLARSQFQVIYFTNKAGEITQKELLQIMQVEPATLTVIIDGLAKKGLLKRSENKKDKRSNVIKLTRRGENVQKKVPSLHEIIEEKMFQTISKSDQKIVMRLISEISHNLETEYEEK